MKKLLSNRIFQLTAVLAAGIFAGWLIFNDSKHEVQHDNSDSAVNTTWTCSMHPQIRQPEPGKCPICGMDLIPVSAKGSSGESTDPYIHTMSPEAVALANIQTSKVKWINPQHEVYLTGKIAVNEKTMAVITANYAGRLEELFVDYTGQTVKKGDKLATIYSPELVSAQQELLESAKYKAVNPALYNAAREKLRLWKISAEQIQAIEELGEVITKIDVYADISGFVIKRVVSKGDYVNKGNVLFEIANLGSVWVLLDAYESDIPWIKMGEKVSFSLPSVPGREFTSAISFINPMIDPLTRTVSVRLETANPGMLLKPEMFVKAKMMSRTSLKGKSLLIPKTAILWTGKRSVVYVKVPGSEFPAFKMREIVLGSAAGDFYVIESGLQEGEEIVINGVFAIDAAAQLSGNYSMMNRPTDKRVAVPEKFRTQLTAIVHQYFILKNELVGSKHANVKKEAEKMLTMLQSIDSGNLEKEALKVWIEKEKAIRSYAGQIAKEVNIEIQRKHFDLLSKTIIEVAETYSAVTSSVYVDYCPMAIGDKGAYWLSEFKEIRNPYFGESMLECGEVKRVIGLKAIPEVAPLKSASPVHQH
jgi:membrane fusion protein, copper/silver efflux system